MQPTQLKNPFTNISLFLLFALLSTCTLTTPALRIPKNVNYPPNGSDFIELEGYEFMIVKNEREYIENCINTNEEIKQTLSNPEKEINIATLDKTDTINYLNSRNVIGRGNPMKIIKHKHFKAGGKIVSLLCVKPNGYPSLSRIISSTFDLTEEERKTFHKEILNYLYEVQKEPEKDCLQCGYLSVTVTPPK